MGGCSCEVDCEFISPRTIVLVGKTGNGKSATGNSILGMNVLISKKSSSGVTISSELKATSLENGQMINVIDTPGLFDSSLGFECIKNEIVKCINIAPDGVDAFLFVLTTDRFSEEEKAAISCLQTLFGKKVSDYMIVVFTGGDELEEENQSFEDFLSHSCEAIKETLSLCENRYVLFDNKTNDERKRLNQVNELLSLVNLVSVKNGGQPYTNEIFTEMKNQTRELQEQEVSPDDERFKHIYELIESKLKETTLKLEQKLAKERAALNKAEKKAIAAKKKSDDEKKSLQEKLEKSQNINKKLRQQKEEERRRNEAHWRQREEDHRRVLGGCYIL